MHTIFISLLALHIAGGTAGLITGSIAASVKKGSRLHLFCGRIFFYGMLFASLSALVMSWLPDHKNIFLFAVGGFTLYMISTGYRIVSLKRKPANAGNPFTAVDYFISLMGMLFGIFLMVLAIIQALNGNIFGLVPGIFGLICVNYARMDYSIISGKKTVKSVWVLNHITRMMGAMIASYTAFLVVNMQIRQQWIVWLLPTLIGSILISRFIRKYVPVNKSFIH